MKFFYELVLSTLLLGPCSGKKFDINFGNRLYSKEKRPGSPLLLILNTKFDIQF